MTMRTALLAIVLLAVLSVAPARGADDGGADPWEGFNRAMFTVNDGLDRFDVLPLAIATDGAIAALGIDGRRLRPNIVVADVEGLAEREWPGQRLPPDDLFCGSLAVSLEVVRHRRVRLRRVGDASHPPLVFSRHRRLRSSAV